MVDSALSNADLRFFNGLGGFNDRGEYEIRMTGNDLPPAPWINVIANPSAGFIASESGPGPTWAVNSSFFRLTPWANDPVSDPSGECIYLRDDLTREIWTPTPAPIREGTPYTTRHGTGYTIFEHEHDQIGTSLRVGMAETDPVKIQILTVLNLGDRPRSISITSYVEWVLGTDRERTHGHVRTEVASPAGDVMLASNTFEAEHANQVAFSAVSEAVVSYTADRSAFIGRNGTLSPPAALQREGLDCNGDTVPDPCAAMQMRIELQPGETRELTFLLGSGGSREQALVLADRYRKPEDAQSALDQSVAAWDRRLSRITVRTPDPAFDLIANKWSLYQALSCRMWGRIALYQSSGAYGFRDQLQDVTAFVYAEPALARDHILNAASRQFEEGDVQHWWHPDTGRGVRTRFADDLIWLPYVVSHYVRLAGDASILEERTRYLSSRLLDPDEDEIYDVPEISEKSDTVYAHCVRALRRACTAGEHGLPLFGGGDWNDGMNRVGVGGKGESVWLAWFLIRTLREFSLHAVARADNEVADELNRIAAAYEAAVEKSAWDGEWYRRAYYDDGTPLGSSGNAECRIDSIAQSWSVISGAGSPERARVAMQSMDKHLVREDARLLMLLTPSFDNGPNDPGYIQGYLPGVRENGAQYTHAALWAVLATAKLGKGNRAFELYQMINPITHTSTPEGVDTYKVEPYVVAADVYTAEGHLGRGGWTWYTGSASWLYRVGLEAILGFRKTGDTLAIEPCIPDSWDRFEIDYRFGSTVYSILIENPMGLETGVVSFVVDGVALTGPIQLVDDARHHRAVGTLKNAGNPGVCGSDG